MLNWLKSGKLSNGTSDDKVVCHEGGEGPRETEDLEATETEYDDNYLGLGLSGGFFSLFLKWGLGVHKPG